MEDDFVKFLIGGIIILALFVAIFSGAVDFDFTGKTVAPDELTISNIDTSRTVGLTQKDSTRTFSLGSFSANFEQGTRIYDLGSKELKNGLFSSESIEFYVSEEDIPSAYVEFTVVRTNKLEPLAIRVNGVTVALEKFDVGTHRIELSAEAEMKIEIAPLSSTWQIWAPNLYELKDIKISVDSFTKNSERFFFDLDEEFDNFIEGRIDFELDHTSGDIIIDINGNIIYEGSVRRAGSISFTKNDVRRGPNSVAIGSAVDSSYEGRASVVIFFGESTVQAANIPFTLTDEEAVKAQEVQIRFTVTDIERNGGISIKAYKGSELVYDDFDKVEEKTYTLRLGNDQIKAGANHVEIESVGEARFKVKNINVKVLIPHQED